MGRILLVVTAVWLTGCTASEDPMEQVRRIPLLKAAMEGDTAALQEAISAGTDIDTRDRTGYSALHWAAQNNRPDCVRALLQAGAPVNAVSLYGTRPIESALMGHSTESVAALLAAHADLGPALDERREPVVVLAAAAGEPKALQMVIESGADVPARNAQGQSALHRTINAENVRILLKAGADPNVRDNGGRTPLHSVSGFPAIVGQATEAAAVLIGAGADVNSRDLLEITPLFVAAQHCNHSMIEALLRARADPNARSVSRLTPLAVLGTNKGAVSISGPLALLFQRDDASDCDKARKLLIMGGAR